MAANMMRGGTKNLKRFTVVTVTTYDNGKQVENTHTPSITKTRSKRASVLSIGVRK